MDEIYEVPSQDRFLINTENILFFFNNERESFLTSSKKNFIIDGKNVTNNFPEDLCLNN